MASINKDWCNCLIWVTINPCLSRICLYSDAVRSFPPVATIMVSDPRTARFGPRLSSSKIFSQIRSPPPDKHLRQEALLLQSSIFFVFPYPIWAQPGETTIVSLVLSLLKEKLLSKHCLWVEPGWPALLDWPSKVWPSWRDVGSRNPDLGKRGSLPSLINTKTMTVFMLETLKSFETLKSS